MSARSTCATPGIMGADAVLLIVAALDDDELAGAPGPGPRRSGWPRWSRSTTRPSSTGRWPPVPTWSGSTSGTCAPSRSTGHRALRMGERMPAGVVAVAESGIRDAADVERLADAGYTAVLVGETLVRSADRTVGRRRPARRPGMTATAGDGDGPELFVKICGITSEADALLAVGMGASAVGLHLRPVAPSDGAVGGGRHRQAPAPRDGHRRRVPGRVAPAGGRDRRADRPAGRPAARVRVGRGHPVDGRAGATGPSRPSRPGTANIERFPEYGAQTLLVDGANPGSGELFDWRLAEGVVDPGRLMVSGGLRPENVAAAVAHLHPWGVDVSTGVEASPG